MLFLQACPGSREEHMALRSRWTRQVGDPHAYAARVRARVAALADTHLATLAQAELRAAMPGVDGPEGEPLVLP